jgi:polysaccharide biosynthesis protein PelD
MVGYREKAGKRGHEGWDLANPWTFGADHAMSLARRWPGSPGLLRGKRQLRALVPYAEIFGGLGLLVLLDFLLFPGSPGYANVDPHPYWLVVIPIAARYGSLPGYAAGALCALVYLLFAAGRGSFGDLLEMRTLLEPILFFVGGAALGELREAHKRAHLDLARRYDELEENVQDLAERYLASMELSRELERRIVEQTSTVTTLYGAARALDGLDARALAPAVLELAESFVDATASSLYLRREGKFLLEATRPANLQRPEELDVTQGLAAVVVGERRPATVRELLAEATPAQIMRGGAIMGAPLLSEDREVMGVILIERMPFLRFTSASAKLFALLGDWASGAFQRALRFQRTRDRNVEDELTGAYNYAYVLKRLGEEVERSRLYDLPLSVLALRVEGYPRIPPVRLPGVLRTLSLVFRQGTRSIDVLGQHTDAGSFVILLPHLTLEEASAAGERLRREIEAFDFKPFDDDSPLRVTPGAAGYGGQTPEQLVAEAIQAMETADEESP